MVVAASTDLVMAFQTIPEVAATRTEKLIAGKTNVAFTAGVMRPPMAILTPSDIKCDRSLAFKIETVALAVALRTIKCATEVTRMWVRISSALIPQIVA